MDRALILGVDGPRFCPRCNVSLALLPLLQDGRWSVGWYCRKCERWVSRETNQLKGYGSALRVAALLETGAMGVLKVQASGVLRG